MIRLSYNNLLFEAANVNTPTQLENMVSWRRLHYYTSNPDTWEKRTLIFDDFGEKYRIEVKDEYDNELIYICDEKANKSYTLFPGSMKYAETIPAGVKYEYFYYDKNGTSWWEDSSNSYGCFKKLSNRTIAGKECTVCTSCGESYKYEHAGWKRIVFYTKTQSKDYPDDDDATILEAKSYVESIPANSFEVPAGYTKW